MVIDKMSNSHLYEGMGDLFKKAFEYLRNTDFSNMEVGKYEIEGKDFYILVQEFEARPLDKCAIEAHQNYADIQYVVKGREKMGYAPLSTVTVSQPYNPEKDVAKYTGDVEWVTINEGMFALYLPDDAHEPCLAVAPGETVKKIVGKVRVK